MRISPGHCNLIGDAGAAHLYLIDFDPINLPNLKSTIEESYPDVKVWLHPLHVGVASLSVLCVGDYSGCRCRG